MTAIEHSLDGRIITVTLNRPDRRNALNQRLVGELTGIIRSLSQDDFVRVIVLTGAGSTFSAGADLDALASLSSASQEDNLADSRALADLFSAIRASPKVVVAKVNGHAIAGGSGLVAACDIAFAVNEAKFGFTEVRIGFVPALVSVLLRNRLKEADLRDLLLSGRLISATYAAQIGLITEAVSASQLEEKVAGYVETIARSTSREAITRTKRLLDEIANLSFEDAMLHAAKANASARQSKDCQDGVRAFLDKKSPPWVQSWDHDHPDSA